MGFRTVRTIEGNPYRVNQRIASEAVRNQWEGQEASIILEILLKLN